MLSSRYILLFIVAVTVSESYSLLRTRRAEDAEESSEDDSQDRNKTLCDETEDHTSNERAIMASEYFSEPMSRTRTLRMMQRAIEMLSKAPTPRKQLCRDVSLDQDAKNALRFFTGDASIGSTSDESLPSSQGTDDYCPNEITIDGNKRKISDSTAKKILELASSGQSERSIRGKYPWYRRQYLPRLQRIQAGGSQESNINRINKHVAERVDDALARRLPIHDYLLQEWALEYADQIGASNFKASGHWVLNFKKRERLTGRKVTDLSSKAQEDQADEIAASEEQFLENYQQIGHFYPHHRIFNVDQSGHRYEFSNQRSLARRGSRDHVLSIDSANKNTHSHTIQPILETVLSEVNFLFASENLLTSLVLESENRLTNSKPAWQT